MTTDTDADTATFVSGPLAGQQVAKTYGARRQPLYRDDAGRPMPARSGDREFCFGPMRGQPARRGYILMCGYWTDAYVHASVFDAWKAGSADVRRAAVRHYQSPAPRAVAPKQSDRRTDPVATRVEGGAAPRPGWGLAL